MGSLVQVQPGEQKKGRTQRPFAFLMKPPPKWKTAILVWLAIYPSITTLFLLFGDQLLALHPMVRTLVLTLILVPLLVFVLLPLMHKLFGGWLRR